MYNPQLETFLRVADAGSFNKAAEESYITPTAVIKQINLLEESLGGSSSTVATGGCNSQKLGALCTRMQNISSSIAGTP